MLPPNRPPAPVPGEDYYVEDGRWVFTAAYHLRRGYCCGSGCRHCPYRVTPTAPEAAAPPAAAPTTPPPAPA